jgi:hypothetical protein
MSDMGCVSESKIQNHTSYHQVSHFGHYLDLPANQRCTALRRINS